MEKTIESANWSDSLKEAPPKIVINKKNRFRDKARIACRLSEMIFEEITPALKKCNETKDAVIMISAYRKRLKRLHRKAIFYYFLSKIFK